MFFSSLVLCLLAQIVNCATTTTSFSASPTSYPVPIPCTGESCTTFTTSFQDCTVIKRQTDNQYFRFWKSNTTGTGLQYATSPTLRGPWTLSKSEIFPSTFHLSDPAITNRNLTHLWAPDVHFINGTYYLYYGVFDDTTGNGLGFDIALATSTTMDDGSWIDHGSIGLPEDHKRYSSLGANLLISNDSSIPPHLAWGSQNSGMYGMDMASPPLTILPSEKVASELVVDQATPWPSGNLLNEGPFQYRFGGYVYLFYSRGNCCPGASLPIEDVYRVEVCRSQSVTGGYADRSGASCLGNTDFGTLVLASNADGSVWAPGSVGVLDDATEGRVLYYQYHVRGNKDVRFGFNFLEFDGEGWPVLVAERNGTATISGTGAGSASATTTKKAKGTVLKKGSFVEVMLVVLAILIQIMM